MAGSTPAVSNHMTQPPDFDPFELLGVDASADAVTIDRAYKARIRFVHPDIAGTAGLNETKRLNVAREWLLDAELRAKLPPPRPAFHARGAPPPPSRSAWEWHSTDRPRQRPEGEYDPFEDDPLTFDYGAATTRLQSFFDAIRWLSADERARVTYSLGDEPPLFFDEFKVHLSHTQWARSEALGDAVARVWAERSDEDAPLLFPRGRVFGNGGVVANAFGQWILLEADLRRLVTAPGALEALAARCTSPWDASVGQPRYGTFQREVLAFLDDARDLTVTAAERLSRSWHRHMGQYLYGRPGEDWFPGALDHPDPELVSARVAAVDASRIEPPRELEYRHHNGFRYGLRLTGHALALGGAATPGRDYLAPWRDALDRHPSFEDRARWGLPPG